MLVSQEVGAVYTLKDEVSPVLKAMADRAEAFGKLLRDVKKSLSAINEVSLRGFGEQITGISDKLKGIGTKADGMAADVRKALGGVDSAFVESGRGIAGFTGRFEGVATASGTAIDKVIGDAGRAEKAFAGLNTATGTAVDGVIGNLGRADTALDTTTRAATALKDALAGAGAASRDIPRLPRGGGGGGSNHPRPGRGGEHEGGGHGNTYGHHGAGVDAGIFGFMGYESVKSATEAVLHRGMELSHVQEQMRQAGMSQTDIDSATGAAWGEARKYGLDVSKVAGDIKELRFPFGSTEHAINFIDPLEQMRVVLNSVMEGKGNSTADAVYEMARAGELKGLQKPEEFISYFDQMSKVISATGGKVTPKDYMQAMKYGRVASMGWDEDFTTKYLPTLMQSLGPSGGGTAAMSLFGTLAQGKVGKRALQQMEDLGLIGDYSKIIYDKKGDPVGFNPGAVKNTDEMVKNPALWAQKTLLPLLTGKYGDLSNDTNRLHVAEGLGGMFGNRMSAQAIAEFILRMQSINKDVGLLGDAKGIGGADQLLKNDPTAVLNSFNAAWTNLLTALGQSSVQPAIEMMKGLAGGLNSIGQFMQEHPEFSKNFVGVMGGIAAGLAALAVVGLAAFLPGGIAIIALTTLAGGLSGLAAVNWEKVKEAGSSLTPTIDAINKWNTDLRDKIIAGVERLGAVIGDAFSSMIEGVLSKLRKIPGVGHLFDAGLGDYKTPDAYNREAHARARLSDNDAKAFTEGLMPGSGMLWLNSYKTGDTFGGAANDNGIESIAQGVYRGLLLYTSGGGASGTGGGNSGIVNASWDGGDVGGFGSATGGGTFGGSSRGGGGRRSRGGASGGWTPSADDPVFSAVRDASGFDWSHMGVQMGAKAAYLGNHLQGIGASEIAAAAMLGHASVESNFKVDAHNGRLEDSHGLFQWNDGVGRWSGLKRWAAANGRNPNDPLAQLDYAKVESMHMRGPHGMSVWDAMQHAGSLAEANRIWMDYFEAPKVRDYGNRLAAGQRALGAMRALHDKVPVAGAPSQKTITPGKPASKQAPITASAMPPLHIALHLDRKVIARHVVKDIASAMRFPRDMGGPDAHGSFVSPGTPVTDAA